MQKRKNQNVRKGKSEFKKRKNLNVGKENAKCRKRKNLIERNGKKNLLCFL